MNPSWTARVLSSDFPRGAALVLVLLAALSCSSESQDPVEPDDPEGLVLGPNQGQFIDSPVQGMEFASGDRSGTTSAQGVYSFQSGHVIEFSVGDIVLGSTSPARKLSPLHLAETSDVTDPVATNLARFLQTIDDDGNPANGIKITDAVRTAAAGKSINFVQQIADFETDPNVLSVVTTLTTATQTGPRELVDTATAQSHLSAGIRSAFAGQYHGSFCINNEGVAQDGGAWAMTVAPDGKVKFEFAGVVDFNISCAMALNGSVFAHDPDAGSEVCGSFAPGFLGHWSHGAMSGAFSESSHCTGSASIEADQTICGE